MTREQAMARIAAQAPREQRLAIAGLAEVTEIFGPGVVRPDGSLDRPGLAEIVFADPELRARLNAVVHPRVRARMRELEQAAGDAGIVVHDVPLIAENNLAGDYDLVVVVDAPRRVQADRLVRHRGMTREQAMARIAAQAPREQRLAIAGLAIDNSGSLGELDRQVGELWAELRRMAQPGRE